MVEIVPPRLSQSFCLLICSFMHLIAVIFERPMGNTSATEGCPCGWRRFRLRCFHYISQGRSWVDAQIHCIHLGGSLASIHSLREYCFVQNVTRGLGNNFPLAWIGGTDAPQGKWIWVDGTPFDFTKWAPGQPDNYGGEHCLEMNFGDQKLWNDIPCKKHNPSVCARRAS
uniref:C-type lectin domain-containing protein n=1 Tax=Scleropages formosus TaxID=113540 RepID=A0A8C9R7T0_SCLFO